MPRICFVCDEIYPTRPGGAGSLIYNLAQGLLADGNEVLLLLNLSRAEFEQFDRLDRLGLPGADRCRAYHVAALCRLAPFGEEDFSSRYDWEAACYDFACRQVYELEQPGLIEFVDYCGPAYYALCARRSGLSYQGARILVRLHGTIELIDRYANPPRFDFDRYCLYALERSALRLADGVLYPTPSFLDAYYPGESRAWPGETRLSPPVVEDRFPRVERAGNARVALFYGRLYTVKGAGLFVDAALAYLAAHPETELQFHLAGADSFEPPVEGLRTYQEYLLTRIPARLRSRFTFLGFVPPERLAGDLPQVKFAVFPSFFETFCLAAHELRRAGVALLLSSIPAFGDYFQPGVDALFFDGSRDDLLRQIERLDRDAALLDGLSCPPPSPAGAALDFYRAALGASPAGAAQSAPPGPGAPSVEAAPRTFPGMGVPPAGAVQSAPPGASVPPVEAEPRMPPGPGAPSVEAAQRAQLPPPGQGAFPIQAVQSLRPGPGVPPAGAEQSMPAGPGDTGTPLGLLVCILEEQDEGEGLARTLASLEGAALPRLETLCLRAAGSRADGEAIWLLGGLYTFQDRQGRPLPVRQARTRDALLLLRAGDEVHAETLRRGAETLQRNPGLAGVAGWKWVAGRRGRWLHTFPLAIMPELLPFERLSPFTRTVLRTPPGVALADLFDPRAGALAEIACLWKLAAEGEILQLPAPLVTQPAEAGREVGDSFLFYLVLQETSPDRLARLARYLLLRLHAGPAGRLLLQAAWQAKSGLVPAPDAAWRGWRRRWVKKLERGGSLERQVLMVLRRLLVVLK
jgi:glycosyltransferase involved in cell wall biosynthesis